jgi:hypothetical protein
MTKKQAEIILEQAGEAYFSAGDLHRIRARAFDPLIKKACDKLLERRK